MDQNSAFLLGLIMGVLIVVIVQIVFSYVRRRSEKNKEDREENPYDILIREFKSEEELRAIFMHKLDLKGMYSSSRESKLAIVMATIAVLTGLLGVTLHTLDHVVTERILVCTIFGVILFFCLVGASWLSSKEPTYKQIIKEYLEAKNQLKQEKKDEATLEAKEELQQEKKVKKDETP